MSVWKILSEVADADVKHSQHCVCKGTGKIKRGRSDVRGLPTAQFGTQGLGGEWTEPCPYGDLRVNKPSDPVDTHINLDDEGWDL